MNNLSTAISTMPSVEIAELTGKKHKHVMRDIRTMQLEKAKEDSPNLGWHCVASTYINKQNKSQPCYLNTTVNLLTGYDAAKRMMVIQRWQQLENKATPAIPQTYSAALLEAAKLAEQTEKLQLELKHKDEMLEEAKPLIGFAETTQKAASGILIRDLAYLAQNDGIKIGEKRL